MEMSEPVEACHAAVGIRVRHIRETLDITQADLAGRCGMERTSINNIEAGRQRLLLQTVEKLARGLGTTPRALLKGVWW
jgi:transcriptional regulator with XRE-family HTH domain